MAIKPSISRQAVVVIHGIGEQWPMDTLREFAEAVAPPNKNSQKPPFHSKPDQFSNSFELRRLTANRQRDTYKTDYFELYWAHLMDGTELRDIIWWIRHMFWRLPDRIPKRLRWIFYVFWGTALTTLLTFIWISSRGQDWLPAAWQNQLSVVWFKTAVSLFVALIAGGVNALLLNYLGDAVRYFTPRPRNVPKRQQIRTAGVDLLRRLHEAQDRNGYSLYDRIVVVGHSLGSVIAYDIISLYWSSVNTKLDLQFRPSVIDAAEVAATAFQADKIDISAYRQAQFDFWVSQYKDKNSWRVSDLITLGSPLSSADLHLADGADKLKDKQNQREFPTSPPRTEPPTVKQIKKLKDKKKQEWFSFPASDDGSKRILHHAALFAMTRWTNMFFENDYVGGPITCFGPGVENKGFAAESYGRFFGYKLPFRRRLPFQSHTHYWDKEEPESLCYLQSKMQLTFKTLGLDQEQVQV